MFNLANKQKQGSRKWPSDEELLARALYTLLKHRYQKKESNGNRRSVST